MLQKKHQELLSNIKKGDKIITRGGVVGKVVDIIGKNKDKVVINVNNTSNLTILKSYIVSLDQ